MMTMYCITSGRVLPNLPRHLIINLVNEGDMETRFSWRDAHDGQDHGSQDERHQAGNSPRLIAAVVAQHHRIHIPIMTLHPQPTWGIETSHLLSSQSDFSPNLMA